MGQRLLSEIVVIYIPITQWCNVSKLNPTSDYTHEYVMSIFNRQIRD